jgi:citrate lyase synthetase
MATQEPVPIDKAKEIRELADLGIGRNKISQLTGINASTVRQIIDNKHQTFIDKLTPRQIQNLLNNAFRHHGR